MITEERAFYSFLSSIHSGLYALEAMTLPRTINELGPENASAAAAFILEALRQELDLAEIKVRKERIGT